ncbi:MAG: Thiol:disulfide interchange protein DsbD [Alphaproteobacteria bacterium MarineAlpha11_Bin1]|nr:MAG: Thiol:disulfide interchange protein DsbD [Alphaproteobacteria bacterium MarineAlpha11_Bin1]|tara:strand:+ start:9815 stop:12022 length:2208 start_codon:yes stop_codon:yes gene_type:complete
MADFLSDAFPYIIGEIQKGVNTNMFQLIRPSFKSLCGILAALTVVVAANGSSAMTSAWFESEHGKVRLIAGGETSGSGKTLDLGLQFRMKPGWKIYWRSPGDAGFPPHINWAGSINFDSAKMSWPIPERFSVLGLETLGYKKEVVFPIIASVLETGKEVTLNASVRFLTCDDICVPYEANFLIRLPAGVDMSTPQSGIINQWWKRVPAIGEVGPLDIKEAELAGSGENTSLIIRGVSERPLESPDLFVEGPPDYRFSKPSVKIRSPGTEVMMRIGIRAPKYSNSQLDGETVTLTLVDGNRAVEREFTLKRASAQPVDAAGVEAIDGFKFLSIIGLAILGGLILNLMPCVLPVLSIKLLTFVNHGGGAPAQVRAGFLASAAGIITCFLGLGTVVVSLRGAGLVVGWGIQFQQPVFLAFMVTILTLFACNMWGFFEFRMPSAISEAAVDKSSLQSHRLGEHFLTGIFATILATPCTAPFLGTAIGFALSRGLLEIYVVFLALGIGLAVPWIAVAIFPALAYQLPKPGPWMITVKRLLSVALIGVALWLLSVMRVQVSGPAIAIIFLFMLAIAFTVAQYSRLSRRARPAVWIVIGLLTAFSMVGASRFSYTGSHHQSSVEDKIWREFDLATINSEVAEGKTVFVDVTADWCLTCKANKFLVLNRERITKILNGSDVIAMRADWTKPDPEIYNYLRSFGRYGIPFNVVYGPNARRGLSLPEILTETAVIEAIQQAGGKK